MQADPGLRRQGFYHTMTISLHVPQEVLVEAAAFVGHQRQGRVGEQLPHLVPLVRRQGLLDQFAAQVRQCPAVGDRFLAGLAVGFWDFDDVRKFKRDRVVALTPMQPA